jgi:hypothetical protein
MADWKLVSVLIRVESSFDGGSQAERFRFWDFMHAVPSPHEGVEVVEIQIDGFWETTHFNTVWGRSQFGGKGAWLKQKVSRHFSADTGDHKFAVRYRMSAEAAASHAPARSA